MNFARYFKVTATRRFRDKHNLGALMAKCCRVMPLFVTDKTLALLSRGDS